jgi:uncharacterized protein YjbJ (UPF0337 family)
MAGAFRLITQTHGGEVMDKDRVKGKMDDAAGRIERQVGEWSGDTETQAKGAAQQVKGKAENAWGKVKDAARDAKDEAKQAHGKDPVKRPSRDDEEAEREYDKDRGVA